MSRNNLKSYRVEAWDTLQYLSKVKKINNYTLHFVAQFSEMLEVMGFDMNENKNIGKTRAGFESGFAENDFYSRQTQDDKHLADILKSVEADGNILDLGTGSGYLAFPLAAKNPVCHVVGLDIVPETLKRNRQKAAEQSLSNLEFLCYDGITLPFPDRTFKAVVTRYALHHFPEIKKTFCEISRILKPGGQLFISDPTPNDGDSGRFVDTFMQMKDDGHIKYYTQNEFEKIAESVGLELESCFISKIRFPRKNADSYSKILNEIDKQILNGYAVEIKGDEIYITEKVLNLCFRNSETQ